MLLCAVTSACNGFSRRPQGGRNADREPAATKVTDTASRQVSPNDKEAVPPTSSQSAPRDSVREKEMARVKKALERMVMLEDKIREEFGDRDLDEPTLQKLDEIRRKEDSLQRILESYAPPVPEATTTPDVADTAGEEAAAPAEFDADRHAQNEQESLLANVRNLSVALYAILALLVLTWAAIILLFVTRPSRKFVADELRNKLRRLQSETGSQLQDATSQQGRQQDAIRQLQAQVAELGKAQARPQPAPAAAATPVAPTTLQPGGVTSRPRRPQLFMKQPAAGGYFDATTQLAASDQAIYILTPEADGIHAAYSFSPSDRSDLRRALDNPQTYIDPVCLRKDEAASPGSGTYACRPGRLRYDGARWVVEEKAYVTIFR